MQGGGASPAFEALAGRRQQIATDLSKLEKQIYDLESVYFTADYTNFGNVVKGFNEFLTSKSAQSKNKNRQFRLEDRVFSLSSITSPGSQEAAGTAVDPTAAPGVYVGMPQAMPAVAPAARGVSAPPPPKRRY